MILQHKGLGLFRVKLWGNPWHGPVRDGGLTLPNATTRAKSQPEPHYDFISGVLTAIPDTWGGAHLVKVPGVPEVVRSVEEQAEDDAAGRQWRNTAVLSGDRLELYGKPLDGWLYIDPDGVRWRVTCPDLEENTVRSFGTPWSGTLTLSRFGEFGGAAESHSYPVSSGWGVTGDVPLTSGRIRLESIKPDGSAAILMVHQRRLTSEETQIRWPYAFLELTISGPGAAATVACSVVKARSVVSQKVLDFDLGPDYLAGYYLGPGHTEPPSWRFQLASTPTPPGEGNFAEWGGRECKVFSGPVNLTLRRTLSIWYDASGTRQDVDFVLDWAGTLDMPAPTEDGLVCSGTASWTAAIQVGGVVRCEISGAWAGAASETLDGVNPGSMTWTRTVTTDGIDYVETVSGDADPLSWQSPPLDDVSGYFTGGVSFIENNATVFNGHLDVIRYAPQVIGLCADRPSARAYHPPATPTGTASGAVTVASTARRYGAWNPFDGAAVWLETSPVCWV
ncbi:hypothetical protein LF844_09915 [Metapseudomonas lalkuanensis]|uniref:hypothetical protein n=1 Tax=Metapseudomonas lalkuanensis TaxID=2604832 RepID=UPI001CF2C58E|nr:hypothetical protein [Pseudomonas lalkuanensis]UCP00105.1 hypothetical protein LF844_09915 [Pseudomonas lalkuanensis]